MTMSRHAVPLLVPLLVALAVTACAPGASDQGASTQAEDPAATVGQGPPPCPDTISIRDFAYDPESCRVTVGSTLTFVNDDDVPHTATAEDGAVADFDTGTLQPGASATVTLDTVGASPYFCEIHPSMRATVEVVAESGDGGAGDGSDGDASDDASDDDESRY